MFNKLILSALRNGQISQFWKALQCISAHFECECSLGAWSRYDDDHAGACKSQKPVQHWWHAKYESLQSPGSVWREELDTCLSRRADTPSVDGLIFLWFLHSQPGKELPWDLPWKVQKWMQWPARRSKARSGTRKTHFPWQHLQVQDHTVCPTIALFLTSHLHWNLLRAAPTQPNALLCQVTVSAYKMICWWFKVNMPNGN